MKTCKWDIAWVGYCNKPTENDSDYCKEHTRFCTEPQCQNIADHSCSVASSMVCGAALCKEHQVCKHHYD